MRHPNLLRRRFLVAVIAALVVMTGLPNATLAAEHTKDSLATVKKNVAKKKAVIIDVREQREWNAGHLKGAILVPLSELRAGGDDKEFIERLKKRLPADTILYCHCRSGGRVLPASDILHKLKYDARPLKTGYAGLLRAGFKKAGK